MIKKTGMLGVNEHGLIVQEFIFEGEPKYVDHTVDALLWARKRIDQELRKRLPHTDLVGLELEMG